MGDARMDGAEIVDRSEDQVDDSQDGFTINRFERRRLSRQTTKDLMHNGWA